MRVWTDQKELKNKSLNVLVFDEYIYAHHEKRAIGALDSDEFSNLHEFLDKFGRRFLFVDIIDYLFGESCTRYEIDFRLLYSGCKLYKENRTKFEEAVKKCRNEKEFMIVCGIR